MLSWLLTCSSCFLAIVGLLLLLARDKKATEYQKTSSCHNGICKHWQDLEQIESRWSDWTCWHVLQYELWRFSSQDYIQNSSCRAERLSLPSSSAGESLEVIYMRELLGTPLAHSDWALFVSQCRSSTALRSKQIGHNRMDTTGKKNLNKKDIVFQLCEQNWSDAHQESCMIQGVFLTFVQGNAFFGLKIGFFGFMLVLLGALHCVLILCYTWGSAIQLLCCIIKLAEPTV
jgi:hypothetical protein